MILDRIAHQTRQRVAAEQAALPLAEMRRRAEALGLGRGADFERALAAGGLSFICEVKRASPSKGLIAADFDPVSIARQYAAAGASAISVLTEPEFFLGSDDYLAQIAAAVTTPTLRKDFVVDPYQIYQARTLGAAAVLLICRLLSGTQLADWLALAGDLGLACLVETHDQAEIDQAVTAGARLIGVNNRDLATFQVDLALTERLAGALPDQVTLVAESGVHSPGDVARLRRAGVDAVLVGERLMTAPDKAQALDQLRSELPRIKLCGLSRPQDVAAANQARPDYVGFVFAPSSRQVDPDQASRLRAQLDPGIAAVGVFVDADESAIAQLGAAGTIDLIQLHGQESAEQVARLRRTAGLRVIKAVRLDRSPGPEVWAAAAAADAVLLDAGAGSGRRLDWSDLPVIDKPWFLAGGIDLDNLDQALQVPGHPVLDLSSGAETAGAKDPAKMIALTARTHAWGSPRLARRAGWAVHGLYADSSAYADSSEGGDRDWAGRRQAAPVLDAPSETAGKESS
ncbi:MAG: indole-3-glycerol phosphate synthase TrpC [Propionibacteriaceae bacterium]|jgi:indole-3-glycerol phosphate synthase/phosphoribosylanthranilate isomerase|nr:indole-3-glycerol phosphate synthase TrpC [Propionibacteriaceae bacterium]